MAGIWYTKTLNKSAYAGSVFASADVNFPEMQVFATATLSAYQTSTPEKYAGFQTIWAEAYIVTPQTPMTSGVGCSFPRVRANQVFLRTDRLSFWLQVSNGNAAGSPPMHASALGVIYEYEPQLQRGLDLSNPARELNLAVHTDDGTVIGTHTSIQLDGGPDLDEEQAREQVLAEAQAVTGHERDALQITAFTGADLPTSADFRINADTGRPEPLVTPTPDQHPFRR